MTYSAGSSPRLRGTLRTLAPRTSADRFIPAPAGNASPRGARTGPLPVHPRACGERWPVRAYREPNGGSSPRLRGTRALQGSAERYARFIPAPAGNAFIVRDISSTAPVHPRACGERDGRRCLGVIAGGSSPRLRGTLHRGRLTVWRRRFIPAPAGNARREPRKDALTPVHPRACGERSSACKQVALAGGSSPRLRGTHRGTQPKQGKRRFIPAPAGNAVTDYAKRPSKAVHPRACGERDQWD